MASRKGDARARAAGRELRLMFDEGACRRQRRRPARLTDIGVILGTASAPSSATDERPQGREGVMAEPGKTLVVGPARIPPCQQARRDEPLDSPNRRLADSSSRAKARRGHGAPHSRDFSGCGLFAAHTGDHPDHRACRRRSSGAATTWRPAASRGTTVSTSTFSSRPSIGCRANRAKIAAQASACSENGALSTQERLQR